MPESATSSSERLLSIIELQNAIAAAALNADEVMRVVADRAHQLQISGAGGAHHVSRHHEHQAERERLETMIRDDYPRADELVSAPRVKPGDLLLMRPATDQLHLGITTASGFVHADARLRRVVEKLGG